uniref:Uncharacterized protein n=6 Tax=Oryza TaxID=4527 RepID=Q5TKE7_ORYSJ|nr:hypothetical protein [Oryza sativa Japonica Group]
MLEEGQTRQFARAIVRTTCISGLAARISRQDIDRRHPSASRLVGAVLHIRAPLVSRLAARRDATRRRGEPPMEDEAGAARKRKRRGEGKPRPKATKGGSKAKPKGKAAAAAAAAAAAEEAAAAVEKVAAEPGVVVEEEEEEDYAEGITEESIAEVMSWLELEIKLASSAAAAGAAATPAPFAPPPPPPPAAGGGGYMPAAKGVNTSNMEGSCGASFSVSASTVMASVDLRAGAPPPPPLPWPLPGHGGGATAAAAAEEAVDDDEWVDQLLTDGPAME